MNIPLCLENSFHSVVNSVYANLPQALPGEEQLSNCKIISHRGEHDNKNIFENTLPAFDTVIDQGIWGIEFDVRWTRDLQPVVFHDRNLKRVFGSSIEISEVTLAELQANFPMIPSLDEVVSRYGKKSHLMVEIKEGVYNDPVFQNQVLQDIFSPLEPQSDFHFLSIMPEMLTLIDFIPATTFLLISQLNARSLSEMSIRKNYGGITGHYLFLTDNIVKKHKKHRQMVGTGFINSKNCLFREINRGVNWIFSNNAVELQSICNSLLPFSSSTK
ncbi:MAG: glycerophosphodiester phosphodiesterase family protein [Candidatus Desulfaltia sp.]|nr:glycerophosphodiester phosphodiesterase family protein [Candidatus Desulfaltia sp.]